MEAEKAEGEKAESAAVDCHFDESDMTGSEGPSGSEDGGHTGDGVGIGSGTVTINEGRKWEI